MWILSSVAGFFSGLIGSMGLGGGAVLLIYLTVFQHTPQFKAQGINLIFFVPIAVLAVIIYSFKKEIKWKTVLPIVLGGVLGSFGGLYLSKLIGEEWVSKIFAVLLIVLGLREFFTKSPLKKSEKGGIVKKE